MLNLYPLIRPLLFKLDAETAHQLSFSALDGAARLGLTSYRPNTEKFKPIKAMGLEFPTPLGLAAGLDKNGEHVDGLASLGFGFLEIGTVTPRPQPGNAKPRLFRLPEAQAVINRMGFNNGGVDQLISNVKAAKYSGILGINIGKNADTPIDKAADDYLYGLRQVYTEASYVAVNISSPNTANLRALQQADQIGGLLEQLKREQQKLHTEHGYYVPLVIKIAPDMTPDEVDVLARALLAYEMDGVIATNTTISRSGVEGVKYATEQGGLSGRPLTQKSTEVVKQLHACLGDKMPIIASGGVMSLADAEAKLAAGATLIQVYSGLIYQGPKLVEEITDGLLKSFKHRVKQPVKQASQGKSPLMAKRQKNNDPHAEREAQKYGRPIPSREMIMDLLGEQEGPASFKRIATLLKLTEDVDLEALRRRMRAMERDGQVVLNRRASYGLASKMDLKSGRVIGHPDGFGFLVPDEGGDDLFLSARQMRTVMHGDRIVVRVMGVDRRGRLEGALVEVLERANKRIVGRFQMEHGVACVVPDNKRITQDITIAADGRGAATNGQIVMVEIIEQPNNRSRPIGNVVEVLGDHMAPGMEIDVAIRTHELPQDWPAPVEDEISGLGSSVPEADKVDREDLRQLPLVTIDGEDARDFDDAVYCEPHGKGWRLLVAIADVSHYVDFKSALDAEARTRGTSVYFPGQVIPMLPEVLSNGLCSLNPNVDRLCMVCEMFITGFGGVRKYRFFEGVMRSHARLTYTEMAAMVVDNDAELRTEHEAIVPHLDHLYDLYKIFRARRDKRGAIDFDTTETRMVFGSDRKIERIVPTERNDAHKIIEEFMITANVCTAKFLLDKEMPALYRVHGGPSVEKLSNLREFLAELGLTLGGQDEPEPKHYGKLLNSIKDRPDAHLIQTVLLRSMNQAVYSPENIGHFGLAYDAYAHFTSPIRRYPDLLVHRALRHLIRHGSVKKYPYGVSDMLTFGEHCSMTERRADDATRDATDWLKCEYMLDRVGDEYDGLITSVTSFGIFVELENIYVEGLVHITSFGQDYYHYDPVKHRLTGERSNKVYRLADRVKVKVMRVDMDRKRIDFDLVLDDKDGGEAVSRPKKSRKKTAKSRRRKNVSKKGKNSAKKNTANKGETT